MIANIFKKSKPANLIIASILVIFSFLISQFQQETSINGFLLLKKIGAVLIVIFNVLLADFIAKKNGISDQNSYVVLFYALFFFFFWGQETLFELLFANTFLLLALRRIVSFKSRKELKKKIFDASLWISVAVLFSFWSVLFYVVLYIGLLIYASGYYKYWLIPFIGAFIVFVGVQAITMFWFDTFWEFDLAASFDFSSDFSVKDGLLMGVLGVLFLGVLFMLSASIRDKTQAQKSSYVLILLTLIIAILIALIYPVKHYSVLLFSFYPMALLMATVFEKLRKEWFRHVIVYGILILAIIFNVM